MTCVVTPNMNALAFFTMHLNAYMFFFCQSFIAQTMFRQFTSWLSLACERAFCLRRAKKPMPCLPCRFVGARRAKSARRRKADMASMSLRFLFFAACTLCDMNSTSMQQISQSLGESNMIRSYISATSRRSKTAARFARSLWHISGSMRNRLAHAVHGNGKGKSKGKQGKAQAQQLIPDDPIAAIDPVLEIRESVRAVHPQQATLRKQSTLLQEDWDAPVVPHQCLGKKRWSRSCSPSGSSNGNFQDRIYCSSCSCPHHRAARKPRPGWLPQTARPCTSSRFEL